jgi:hypothetical protein
MRCRLSSLDNSIVGWVVALVDVVVDNAARLSVSIPTLYRRTMSRADQDGLPRPTLQRCGLWHPPLRDAVYGNIDTRAEPFDDLRPTQCHAGNGIGPPARQVLESPTK